MHKDGENLLVNVCVKLRLDGMGWAVIACLSADGIVLLAE